ncbi:MAG: hypothetical protein LBT51_02965 [Fusobacteriaceae bacterium]|jgi:hypothetical protein|nr:hypothetical protein [Fusobacteriaceae bacterium]
MKKFYLFVLFTIISFGVLSAPKLGNKYELKTVISVEGRQGIAVDKDFYYVSSSTALYKYDKTGKLLLKNDNPFIGLEKEANHFGDIDVWNGEIYTGIEIFEFGVSKNIQVAVYDAETLTYKYSIPWNADSGQVEVCGLAVDRDKNAVWMADWTKGRYLYRYDLNTKQYDGKIHLRPDPQYTQGIFIIDGKVLISADDGDADFDESDNIYIADISDYKKTATYVTLFREMKDFKRAGEIEGLSIDPVNGDLLVLTNRGTKIDRGMAVGFYDGYSAELHELYVYKKK